MTVLHITQNETQRNMCFGHAKSAAVYQNA